MDKNDVQKLYNEVEKEIKDFTEKYKDFNYETSTDVNKKLDYLYDLICVLGTEVNNSMQMTAGCLNKISEIL